MSIVNFDNDVCALTDTGLVRTHNEDSNRVERTNNGDLFVVCDGMGGHVGGATASRIGVESICQYVQHHECDIPQQFLIRALRYANERIFAESRANSNLRGMGTTACVALVRNDKVWYAHVGDSRIYYYNAKKTALFRLTKDHSVVQALVDQGLITEAEAEHHPEKNKIRKSLGIKEDIEPEPCQIPLMPSDGDIMLICSDGLSGMMDEEDILEVLTTTPNVNEAGKRLVELAKAGGGTDNITVQIAKFSGIGNRDAVFEAKNKGVQKQQASAKHPSKKSTLYWIVAFVSTVVFLFTTLFLFYNSSDSKTNNSEYIEEPITPTKEDVYLEHVGGLKSVQYNDRGINYLFFIKERLSDNKVEGVRVREDTKEFSVGYFQKVPIIDGKKSCDKYDPFEVRTYNPDGTLIK